MKEEIDYAMQRLKEAVKTLKEGVLQSRDELDKDGVIQRFEFTFELFWKTLKIFLEDKGIQCNTPKDCLKSAFKIGIIEEEQLFLDMLEDRNKMSHIYDKEESEKIFQKIKNNYFPQMEACLDQLDQLEQK